VKQRFGIVVALVLLVLSRSAFVLPQDKINKSKKEEAAKTAEKKTNSTVTVKIKVSVEGKSSLPSGSRIEWRGVPESCKSVTGMKNLGSDGAVSLNLPTCKVKLMVFITGFDTKLVTIDVPENKNKYKDPIRIKVKHQGSPHVAW
jgi:hypothetical protein